MSDAFRYLLRVRYGECDAQQVVFNARYADYVDIAGNEFMRALWGDYANLLKQDIDLQVVRYEIDWQAPARFDDILSVSVACERVGNTSFHLRFSFYRYGEQPLLARAGIVYVLFQPSSGEKLPVPAEMRTLLERGAPGQCVDHAAVCQQEGVLP